MPFVLDDAAPVNCFLCDVHGRGERELPWYDRPLIRREGVGVAFAAVGAFVPGYVLVAPVLHRPSVQSLPVDVALSLFDFLEFVVGRVERRYGPATIFEHGPCRSADRRRSACILHSHVHVLPGAYSFGSLGLPVRTYGKLSELATMPQSQRLDGYLMYREPDGVLCYSGDVGVSQYFRRYIAGALGRPDEWDYAVFPEWENVRMTQEALAEGVRDLAPASGGDRG